MAGGAPRAGCVTVDGGRDLCGGARSFARSCLSRAVGLSVAEVLDSDDSTIGFEGLAKPPGTAADDEEEEEKKVAAEGTLKLPQVCCGAFISTRRRTRIAEARRRWFFDVVLGLASPQPMRVLLPSLVSL